MLMTTKACATFSAQPFRQPATTRVPRVRCRAVCRQSAAALMIAKVIVPDAAGLQAAGELLRAGKLVAFPTETVFGLGANAFDEKAVLDIFRVKGRPLTDPLIVHVPSAALAWPLVHLDDEAQVLFEYLARKFWPGPLTLVARAAPSLPTAISAGTGFVGVRCPSHPVAQSLLQAAGVPVAAPSANRFGHVSPTSAQHVLDDLGESDISVIEADGCAVGIESTVAKIMEDERRLLILRRGGVPERSLHEALESLSLGFALAVLNQGAKQLAAASEGEAQQAPGQLLTHYAPDRPTFLAVLPPDEPAGTSDASAPITMDSVEKSVVVDFAGALGHLRAAAMAYRDLSPSGDVLEASRVLFDTLRWSERVPSADQVLLVDVMSRRIEDDNVGALYDRMFRAASGRRIRLAPTFTTRLGAPSAEEGC